MLYFIYPLILISIFIIKDEYFKVVRVIFSRIRRRFQGRHIHGQRLYSVLLELPNSRHLDGLENYKFFNDLLKELFNASYEYGAGINRALLEIKKGLSLDIKLEIKTRKNISSALLTFVLASMITWCFILLIHTNLSINVGGAILGGILLWQGLGIVIFVSLYRRIYQYMISPIESFIAVIYLLSTYLNTHVAINDAITKGKLHRLNAIKSAGLSFYIEKTLKLVEMRVNNGAEIKADLDILISEAWLYYEENLERFIARLIVLKFVVMCLFFFLTYLATVFLLLQKII